MNLDSLSFALSQISYSVANVTKKNFKTSVQELSALVSKHGIEAERYLLRCLFSHVDFSGDGKSSGKDFHQTQYLIQECNTLVSKPDFVSSVCYCLDNPLNQQKSLRPTAQLLPQISKTLKLNKVQEVAFGIALLNSSVTEIRNFADQFIKQKIPDLLRVYLDTDVSGEQESGFQDSPPEVLHFLLSYLQQKTIKDKTIIATEQKDSFLQSLRKDYPRDQVPIVVAPLLYSDKLDITENKATNFTSTMAKESELSVAEYVTEIGYILTSSFDECRSSLVNLGQHELSAGIVARILGIMARTHTGTGDSVFVQKLSNSGLSIWNDSKDKGEVGPATSWNVEVFVEVVKDLNPNLKWSEVVAELDHLGFVLKDRTGLKILWSALTLAFKDEVLPMETFYAKWRNTDGQVSLFQQVLKNSDLVCLMDYQCQPVAVDVLKAPPEEDSRDISNWKSLNLIESLLYLSDHGHYAQVQELFKYAVQNCPDLSVLGLLQVSAPMNMLRQELLTTLIPVFLGNHPNSAIILQYAWHCQALSNTVKPIIMHSMAEWYVRGEYDQTRLSRILDVAQDLKALSVLLNGSHFPFVIDLACLASRREYLKLDKWLTDKMREHGELFIQACIGFLKRRCPQIAGSSAKEENLPKSAQLPPETLATMITCLQSCTTNLSQELCETILAMVGNCNILLNKPRQAPPGVVKTPRGMEPAFPTGIAVSSASVMHQLPNNSLHEKLDNLGALGSSMANLTLSGSGPPLGGGGTGTGGPPANNTLVASNTNSSVPISVANSIMSNNVVSSVANVGSTGAPTGTPFHLGTGIGPLTSSSVGSPAKMFQSAPTTVTSTHNSFSILPMTTQLGQFSQLDMTNIFPEPISKDVEEEANGYFQRIYNHPPHPTLTIDEFLDLLKKYQESLVKREREVLSCMVRNLFEEYRYFPQYPDKELSITAQVFGGIIEQSIVTYMALGLALRCVLDALRKPHGSKMYYFGITALDRFKTRLKEYPQYCQHLASIPHFHEFPQHLIEYVEYGARSQEPPSRPQGSLPPVLATMVGSGPLTSSGPIGAGLSTTTVTSVASAIARTLSSTAVTLTTTTTITKPSTIPGKPSIANATNIDTLLVATEKDDKLVVPPELVQDKMFFIINNLSQMNLTQKTEEFKELVKEEYWAWAAQYLVLKRASIELNFHTLYSNFLDALKIPELTKYVVQETFRNIKVLLRSDKGIANFSDRSLLKNLGHWLGMITLAKNKPILQMDIDVKALLMEAYHNGQQELLYVVPFVAKVLESCAKSKVFRPPNPWIMGIMNLLAEMHQEANLKLNLKFEIEVLCKTLSIDINELKPGSLLKDQDRLSRIEPQLSPLPKTGEQLVSGVPQVGIQLAPSHHLQPGVPMGVPPGPTTAIAVASAVESAIRMANTWTCRPNTDDHVLRPPPFDGDLSRPHIASLSALMPTPESSLMPNVDEVMGPMVAGPHLGGGATPTSVGSSTAAPVTAPVHQPQFSYMEIDVLAVSGLAQHIQINNQLPLFQAHPHLKKFVRPAIELAVQEWIMPVVDRSIKISLTTCEQIAKKDFALDPEESRMRIAAHHMIRNLTAGMTMITCRDPLHSSIMSNLKAAFMTALRAASEQQKTLIEQAAQVVSQDNVELACCFVQKTAIEKALGDMDKRLATEFELRKHARSEGRRYCDPVVLTYQAERMPEQIRLKVGCVTQMQMAVYEEFFRFIPGFLPEKDPHAFAAKPLPVLHPYPVDDLTQIYNKVISELDHYLHNLLPSPGNPHVAALHSLLEAVSIARNTQDAVTAMALIQKAVEGLLEGLNQLPADPEVTMNFRDGHLVVLKGLADTRAYGHSWVSKQVTRCLLECTQAYKYNLDAIDCLIRHHLVNMQTYDLNLAKSMENGLNYIATAFAIQLVKLYMIDERQTIITETDLYHTMEMLIRIAGQSRPPPPETLVQLIQLLRASSIGSGAPNPNASSNNSTGNSLTSNNGGSTIASMAGELDRAPGGPISMMHSGISQAREFDDPPGLQDKTEFLLREWVSMYHSSGRDTTKAFSLFVHQMNVQGILKTDDLITRFFRLSTEMCVELCYRALGEHSNAHVSMIHNKCFPTLDAYVRLIALLVKHSGDATNSLTKANLLNKVLGIVTGVLLQDHEVRNSEFQQLPYHRIFIMLFLDLSSTEPVLESLGFQVILAFCNTLHILRPSKAPGFAYAWLEIMSHRVFLGRVLAQNPLQKAWSLYAQLLVDLFRFLAPFLRNVELPKPIQLLYKGTLRVLLVLLHDFPEFLCDYHYSFCDVIPPNCIQMRNLILSAFPRNMRLPDPFTPNLKVELLQEIMQAPRALSNFPSVIDPPSFKKNLDSYIQSRSPVTFLSELRSNLQVSSDPGMRYNIVLINALVLYVGTQAISYIQSKGLTPSMGTITHSSHMDIFQNLAVDLDTEGRYLFLNAIANQLRYPNSHTHYFSCTLLYLFAEANTEAIQEQITRVLLERLIVNRPHPWGLLVTFIELIKNSTFKFWNHEFVRCAPEIEKLFESVARSCMQQKPPIEQTAS